MVKFTCIVAKKQVSIEVGWTQAWIPNVLAMRELNINLREITEKSKVASRFESIRKKMIPDDVIMNLN